MVYFKIGFLLLFSVIIYYILSKYVQQDPPLPIVLWHGMGDSAVGLEFFKKYLENEIPNVYVHSLSIGDNFFQDTENSYFMNINKQVEIACQLITNDTKLQNGYNAIGFSQGGLFIRGVAQRCPNPPIKNLISIGGPQQGVFGLPHCLYPDHTYCDYVRKVLNIGAYWSWIQNDLVQAEYWHDPINEDMYKHGSVFLSDINNELTINEDYRTNLNKLEKLVLVKFENDSMVIPKDSEWFGYYAPGQGKDILPLEKSQLYIADRLGLKQLNQAGKLDFLLSPGDHLRFTRDWFTENIIQEYLVTTSSIFYFID